MSRPWRVAVVGTGPGGMYAAGHLVDHFGGDLGTPSLPGSCEVDLYDRLPTPWGLVRGGVAPDHADKKGVTRVFDAISTYEGVAFLGGIEVGRDVGTDELAGWYDAVVYAYGAARGRVLDLPGADRPGVHTAHDVVAWYNGHPDHAGLDVDLGGERVVIVGNGNVALDVARMLALPAAALGGTDIAPHAEAALRDSGVAEIVVVARRGPEHAAFGTGELEELLAVPDVEVVVDPADLVDAPDHGPDPIAARKLAALRALAAAPPARAPRRRVVLRFCERPERIDAGGVRFASTRDEGTSTDLAAGTVVLATGYESVGLPGLPFDAARGVLRSAAGRLLDDAGSPLPGAYTTGWVKRGPSGMIGTNKACARETVTSLVADAHAGHLPTRGTLDRAAVLAELRSRRPDLVSWRGWRAIDRAETAHGRAEGRPRAKLTRLADLVDAARRG